MYMDSRVTDNWRYKRTIYFLEEKSLWDMNNER